MILTFGLGLESGLSLAILAVAAVMDLKKNEVANWVWLLLGGLGFLFSMAIFRDPILFSINLMFSVGITVGALIIWYLFSDHLGGADVKALIALGFCVPTLMLLTIGWAGVFALIYIAFQYLYRTKKIDLLALKVPFIPFLFVGLLSAILVYAVG